MDLEGFPKQLKISSNKRWRRQDKVNKERDERPEIDKARRRKIDRKVQLLSKNKKVNERIFGNK